MVPYLTTQIIKGNLKYAAVVKRYPQHKAGIDDTLLLRGYDIDKDGNCVPLKK